MSGQQHQQPGRIEHLQPVDRPDLGRPNLHGVGERPMGGRNGEAEFARQCGHRRPPAPAFSGAHQQMTPNDLNYRHHRSQVTTFTLF